MNKDKLISLIIKKQSYKETKAFKQGVASLKPQATTIAIQSIQQILTTQYNAQAKLYTVRFLKDCFEKGNPMFIEQTSDKILPIIRDIACDQQNQKALAKYAGSSYTKTEELPNFKAIVSSLFRMCKECIVKWADWVPGCSRKFQKALEDLKRNEKIKLNFQFKYFRNENQQLFRENCHKNGLKLTKTNNQKKIESNVQSEVKSSHKKIETQSKPPKSKNKHVQKINQILTKAKSSNSKQISKLQDQFSLAINNYIENSNQYDENLIERCFLEFENIKNQAPKSTVSKSDKKSNITPLPLESQIDKQTKKSKQQSIIRQQIKKKQQITKSKEKQVSLQVQKQQISKDNKTSGKSIKKTQNSGKKSNIETQNSHPSQQPTLKISNEAIKQKKKQVNILNFESPESSKIIIEQKPRQKIRQKQKQVVAKEIKKQETMYRNVKRQPKKVVKKQQIGKPEQPITRQKKLLKQEKKQEQLDRVDFTEDSYEQSQQNVSMKKADKLMAIMEASKEAEEFESNRKIMKKRQEEKIVVQTISPRQVKSSKQINQDKQSLRQVSENEEIERFNVEKNTSKQINQSKDSFRKASQVEEIERLNIRQNTNQNKYSKANVNSKLLHQNTILREKMEKLAFELEKQKKQKTKIMRQKSLAQDQLIQYKTEQQKMMKKIKGSVSIQQYNSLRQEFDQQKKNHKDLFYDNCKMKEQIEELKNMLNNEKLRLRQLENVPKTVSRYQTEQKFASQIKYENKAKNLCSYSKQQLDPDYVQNLTAPSKIDHWLNEHNINLFKKALLGISEVFYRDQYVNIAANKSVYTRNSQNFLSLKFSFQFKNLKNFTPEIQHKNCQQIDLWIKPFTGSEDFFEQQMVAKLGTQSSRIIKSHLKLLEHLEITFLLPFMYLTFLREEDFQQNQFCEIFLQKSDSINKSKIFALVFFVQQQNSFARDSSIFKKMFKNSIIQKGKVMICLSEGINDYIFLVEVQLLRNNKAIVKGFANSCVLVHEIKEQRACGMSFFCFVLKQYEYLFCSDINYQIIFYQAQIMSKKKLSKVIILGDSAVGKTSLLNSYVDQKFLQSYKATVGADFMEKEVIVDGKVINLEIWDTAGQEKFRSLGGAFYRGADCCVLVYDITIKKSFDNIQSWITEFLNQGAPKEPQKFPFILVGNKNDRQSDREVEESAVEQFIEKHPRIKHMTTSAKNRQGVESAFEKIALASVENKQEEIFIPVEVPSSKLKTKKTEKKKGCC